MFPLGVGGRGFGVADIDSACFEPNEGLTCADVCASQGYTGCLADCWLESQFAYATFAYYSSMANCRGQVMSSSYGSGIGACEIPLESYAAARCCCGPL